MYIIEHKTDDTYLQNNGTFSKHIGTAQRFNITEAEEMNVYLRNQHIPTWIRSLEDIVI